MPWFGRTGIKFLVHDLKKVFMSIHYLHVYTYGSWASPEILMLFDYPNSPSLNFPWINPIVFRFGHILPGLVHHELYDTYSKIFNFMGSLGQNVVFAYLKMPWNEVDSSTPGRFSELFVVNFIVYFKSIMSLLPFTLQLIAINVKS